MDMQISLHCSHELLPYAGQNSREAASPIIAATTMQRRQFLTLATGLGVAFAGNARADTYPGRPVHVIVGFPPGAASDINARLIGDWLSQKLGQQFVTDNRPGAG